MTHVASLICWEQEFMTFYYLLSIFYYDLINRVMSLPLFSLIFVSNLVFNLVDN
jgi:hypothetical protein